MAGMLASLGIDSEEGDDVQIDLGRAQAALEDYISERREQYPSGLPEALKE